MDEKQVKRLEEWFFAYLDRFKINGALSAIQEIKHKHSLRVAGETESLARELNWSPDDQRVARIIGLFHDVGRFSQFVDFGTIDDSKSVNHGVRGAEVLVCENSLCVLSEDDKRRVLQSVRYHNILDMPDDVDCDSARFLRLIRDVDKLDIFYTLLNALEKEDAGERRQLLLDIAIEGEYNPDLIGYIKQKKLVPYGKIKCLADGHLLLMSWVFDINYMPTMRRMRDLRMFEKVCDYLPQDSEISKARDTMICFRDEFIKKESGSK